MRSEQDRLLVRLTLEAVADLDMERIENDPVWESLLVQSPDRETALKSYVRNYLLRQDVLLFTNMPSTNGPSVLVIQDMEVDSQ